MASRWECALMGSWAMNSSRVPLPLGEEAKSARRPTARRTHFTNEHVYVHMLR